MTDAAPISQSERNLRHLLADPGAQAAWYAEKRIDFLEYKVERARERLAALEAELAQAKDEWRAIQAGEAEAPQSDQCLARFAKDQCENHRAENESELVAECNLVDAALDLTGLSSRGWLISKTKAERYGCCGSQ